MRESIGGAWLLGIVLVFMSVFIAYIAITINYSNAYKLKTEMVTAIEQYEGINPTSLSKLDSLIKSHSYRNTMMCPTNENDIVLGITDGVVTVNPTTRQSYCVTREFQSGSEDKYYYNVIVSFDFSLPVLGDLFNFKVSGETNVINYPNDMYF